MEWNKCKLPLEILLCIAEFLCIADLAQFIHAIPVVGQQLPTKQLRQQGGNGDTVLHFLASRGHSDTIALFAEPFRILHTPNIDGMTPLHIAAVHSHYLTVALLLNIGASISALDNHNDSPLHLAIRAHAYTYTRTSEPVTQLLLSHHADPSLPNIDGFTPLHEAVMSHQSPDAVQRLLDAGADVNAPAGRRRWTPLFYAVLFSHQSPGEILSSAGADIHAAPRDTQQHLFSRERGMAIVAVLLRAGPDLEVLDKEGRTVLMETARLGADDAMSLLLKAGASVHARDDQRRTALGHAVMRGNRSTAKRLLEAGTDLWTRDESGRDVVELALWYGHDDMAKVMQRAQRLRPWGYWRDRAG
ncbi:hypothetical protein N7468_008445 [Penicillium chermesinum]|uniref:Ankyrin repeat protein n=1 Tax=Penicillium chermesinum TaxID=63820 RepID=A0A9W9NQ87_9EURO|nr:uncharacterized protein N7468_008445 [Penicillium chermesinum]KAJ5223903.1 hypothetical protein N7468_008445 [Penicillium chermesinum]KAJ6155273.1 hypothetical protein N7470_005839 [Penicillium chermesinum]